MEEGDYVTIAFMLHSFTRMLFMYTSLDLHNGDTLGDIPPMPKLGSSRSD